MITINIYYLRDCRVKFEHYEKKDDGTIAKITTVGDKYVNGKINADVEYNPTADAGLSTFTFIPEDTKIVEPANANQGLLKEKTAEKVKVGPLTTDYTVRLFYIKDRNIIFKHYDWELPGELVKADVNTGKNGFPPAKYNKNVVYGTYNVDGFKYMPDETKKGITNGTPVVDANKIEIGPVKKDDIFNLYYVKNRVIKKLKKEKSKFENRFPTLY